jgi:hypothetical protein
MTESQYSSSSGSSNKYLSGSTNYQTPSYGQSGYTGLSGSAVKEISSTTYQPSSTSYGVSGSTSYGTSGNVYGATGTTYGATNTTYGATNLGNSGVNSGSKITGQTTTSTYERKSNLTGSGTSGSGYNYQTKKY